jgi:hypothetical protein
MQKTIFLSTLAAMLMLLSCKESEQPEPDGESSQVVRKEVNAKIGFGQGSVSLDVDSDGRSDFTLYSQSFHTDADRLEAFLIEPANGAKTVQVLLTGNPIFGSQNLFSYQQGEAISASVDPRYGWTAGNGAIATRHVSESISFNGRWSDGNRKYMGFALSKAGAYHYGWLTMQYSRAENSLSVIEFGYSKVAGKDIKAGTPD